MVNVEVFTSTYGMNKKNAKEIAERLFKILDIPEDTWKKKYFSFPYLYSN